ncbi:hypothetical protein EDL96_12655 [Kocuria soli]|uniref:Helicase XPB/Ssl2 N-terminal domain-containing protein n=1 Tax=Kocuria soli TaxID=2485125 RepID=A0A3N3ZU55_9MICC|nr:helicase-associated domain-containing protein [Kocuria soli]ROZ61687.1 hypothetical protein EDL96_12655 [Kocuria soli]
MPSSFVTDLALRTPAQLRALLELRPDVADATPTSVAELAAALSARPSLQSALNQVDRAQLDVLERAVVRGEHTIDDDVHTRALHAVGLIHGLIHRGTPVPEDPRGNTPRWALSPGVAEALGRYPGGVGRPLAEPLGPDTGSEPPEIDRSLLVSLPPRPAEVLSNFRSRPLGTLRNADRRPVPDDPENHPVDWLLARRLLVPVGTHHVEAPREVGLALNDDDPWSGHSTQPPAPTGHRVNPRIRDNAASAAVAELVRDLTDLRHELRERPAETLRAGGLGIRERRRLATALDVDVPRADRLLGFAHLAGLIEQDEHDDTWRPSAPSFEDLDTATAHGLVLAAWVTSGVVPSATRTQRADGSVITPLTDGWWVKDAPALRRTVLLALAQDSGLAADAASSERAWAWFRPRLSGQLSRHGHGILAECADLGLTGAGAATDLVDLLLRDGPEAVTDTVAQRLPPAVETVVLQSDHTAVAHGPLSPGAAADLRLVADPEGKGAAATFRFSVASLRRALERGHDAESLRDLVATRSEGPVPAALTHLVDEAVRTHGNVRILNAERVVTGRPDLVEAIASSAALDGFEVERVSSEVLVLRSAEPDRKAPRASLRRNPVDVAVLKATEQVGIAPTLAHPGEDAAPSNLSLPRGASPAQLRALFPGPPPAEPAVDRDHVVTVADRLAADARALARGGTTAAPEDATPKEKPRA